MTDHSVLVSADWLAERIDDPSVRVVEVDEDTAAYDRSHIRNAVGVDWRLDLQDPVRRDFVGAEAFARLQDGLGIANDTHVVLYGGNNNWFAAYAYWYYRFYGHARVSLLDGGRISWERERRALTADPPTVDPTEGYRVRSTDLGIRAFRDYIRDSVVRGEGYGLVDVRSPEEFSGAVLAPAHLPQEQSQRPGHIPTARNIPWGQNVDPETGRFKDLATLRALYESVGITPDKEIVAYCRIGERSAITWFVLHELLGYPRVRNYDGSWTEWGSLVGVPIERSA